MYDNKLSVHVTFQTLQLHSLAELHFSDYWEEN